MRALQKIAEFFSIMLDFAGISGASSSLTKAVSQRAVFGKEVKFGNEAIEICISRKAWAVAKKIAPSSNIILSIPVKIEKSEEITGIVDAPIISPLLSINIEERKAEIEDGLSREEFYTLYVSYDTEIIFNEVILKSEFFELSDEFFSVEKDGKDLSLTFGDLIPEEKRGTQEAFSSLMSYFKPRSNRFFNLEIASGEAQKMMFVFFAEKKQIVIKRAIEGIKKGGKLVKAYLLGETKEVCDFTPSFGHYAKSFPMGQGQYDASVTLSNMINGRVTDSILTVFGPAGTGKSTFLHSAMDEIIVKMVEDYSAGRLIKPSAVVSTAYKAVTGLLEDYSRFVFDGLSYVGGSQKREISKDKNDKLIEEIEKAEFNPALMTKLQKEVLKAKERMASRLELYRKVKEFNVFADFKNLQADLKFQIDHLEKSAPNEEDKIFYNEALYAILRIVKVDIETLTIEEAIKKAKSIISDNATKISLVASKLEKQGLISSFFNKLMVELKTGEEINSEEDIELLAYYVKNLNLNEFESTLIRIKDEKKVVVLKQLLNIVEKGGEKLVKTMLSSQNEVEFARLGLFDLANKISHNCKLILRELAYKNKVEVVRALRFFSAPNPYQYLVGQYGYQEKDHKKFLSFVALVYPFVGSSLASINGVFTGSGLNKEVNPFNFVLADEAGMITSIDMVPVLLKAEKAVIVGDPYQLQPIFGIDEMFASSVRTLVNDEDFWKRYSPMEVSAFHLAAGITGEVSGFGNAKFLNEHRRCQAKIINLSKAVISEYHDLRVETATLKGDDLKKFEALKDNLFFFDVKNDNQERGPKVNLREIEKIEKILDRLEAVGFNLTKEVGIITPYAAQSKALTAKFAERLGQVKGAEPRIGTVHKFQGAEYKVILMSTVVSKEADQLNFINNGPYMVNVAVSRAKNHFIMVGDFDKLTSEKKDNHIGKIAETIKSTGVFVPASKKEV